jgi:hypothetical protein
MLDMVLPRPQDAPGTALETLQARIQRFAPVRIGADLTRLSDGDRRAVAALIAAAKYLDDLFRLQVWSRNNEMFARLALDHTPLGEGERKYFMMNKGPWSRIDDNEVFVRPEFNVPPKPPQATFYPDDATREEVDAWIGGLKGVARERATSFYTVIRRKRSGELKTVPYSTEYKPHLDAAREHLLEAAAATDNASLQRFLELRAEAFRSNDYYPSDVAWMEIDAPVEPTIGPYETYEDEWFGYKAAFEAFITIRDDEQTARLAAFGSELQGIEDALPIRPEYRNRAIGALAPIRVVNLVFAAGDASRGVMPAAFNLPNDDRILREQGAKRVMLKNVQEAKFEHVLRPIAAIALSPADAGRVSFDAFFTHILMHELMHGLGPHSAGPAGQPVRLALKDAYAAIEEAKADISGLWALQRLADRKSSCLTAADALMESLFVTFLASAFRSLRFGINEAHGKGIALQLDFLIDAGAVLIDPAGTFGVDAARMRDAIEALTGQIMTIQAEGDYAGAQALLARHVSIRPEVQRVLDRIAHVPVDLAPRFTDA